MQPSNQGKGPWRGGDSCYEAQVLNSIEASALVGKIKQDIGNNSHNRGMWVVQKDVKISCLSSRVKITVKLKIREGPGQEEALPKSGCAKTAPMRGSLRDSERRHLMPQPPQWGGVGGAVQRDPGGEAHGRSSRSRADSFLDNSWPCPQDQASAVLRASGPTEPGICPKRDVRSCQASASRSHAPELPWGYHPELAVSWMLWCISQTPHQSQDVHASAAGSVGY